MQTSETECLDALRDAAEVLGESPTKAQYEELGLTPASTTIRRIVGGWNEAKQKAELETYGQDENGGFDVWQQPEDVDIPDEMKWEELTAQQRWYYKNREHRISVKENRRNELREWFYELKCAEFECERCGESTPQTLDCHHDGEKTRGVSAMVNLGYSKSRIREEINQCTVLCANCHSKEHYTGPTPANLCNLSKTGKAAKNASKYEARRLRRDWVVLYKRTSEGCNECQISDSRCLEFHHTTKKSQRVSRMVSTGKSLKDIKQEIEKCKLLCANCHRKEHVD